MATWAFHKIGAGLLFLAAAIACAQSLPAAAHAAADKQELTPVLVELFTSEGCSDCPPADQLLAQLDSSQFVPGALSIVLSEHVTYWNHLGWRDPFSFEQMDARQQEYGTRFGLPSIYTPQVVVDGTEQFVGSNRDALFRAVKKAAGIRKVPLQIVGTRLQDGKAIFSLQGISTDSAVQWYGAIAADATRSEVARGENAGRTLHHVAVVRVLRQLKQAADGEDFSLPVEPVASSVGNMRVVVFGIDSHSGRVIAAAQRAISR